MKDEDVFAAALLTAQGHSPTEVEAMLNYSQGHTSRLLAKARESGYLLTINRLNLSEQQSRLAEERLVSYRLDANELGIRNVAICATEEFGHGAAVHLERLLREALVPTSRTAPSCSSMAIAWGNDLASAVRVLRRLFAFDDVREEHRKRTERGESLPILSPVRFIPARGELLHSPLKQISPTFLAASMGEIVNGGSGDTYTLATIPAIVPKINGTALKRIVPKGVHMNATQAREFIRNYYTTRNEYLEVFPPDVPISPDAFLTSVGVSNAMSSWTEECIATGGIDRKKIAEYSYGDIAGVFVARPGYERQVASWNAGWIGIGQEHIERCSEGGRNQNRLGVIICAKDKAKARIIYECLKRRWVNELIVSGDLGRELWRLVNREGSPAK